MHYLIQLLGSLMFFLGLIAFIITGLQNNYSVVFYVSVLAIVIGGLVTYGGVIWWLMDELDK
jgi:hypothetical protein